MFSGSENATSFDYREKDCEIHENGLWLRLEEFSKIEHSKTFIEDKSTCVTFSFTQFDQVSNLDNKDPIGSHIIYFTDCLNL